MARIARKHLIEAGKRILGAAKREQRVAAVVQGVQMAGLQGERFIEAVERLGVALERVQDVGEIHQQIGRGIDLERGRQKAVRLACLARLRLRQPDQLQRVEMIGRHLQHARVELRGLAQPTLLVQGDGFLHCLQRIETRRLRHGGR